MRSATHSIKRIMRDVKIRRQVRISCHSERKKKTSDMSMLHYHQELTKQPFMSMEQFRQEGREADKRRGEENIPEWTRQ